MDCKFESKTVNICEKGFGAAVEQPVDCEIVLPDYCSDMGKILKCQLIPSVLSQSCGEARVLVEGSTLVRIIYTGEKNGDVCSYEQEFPFEREINAKENVDGASLFISCKSDYVNCRASGPRKADIHGAFTINISASNDRAYEIISDTECESVLLKKEKISANSLFARKSVLFGLNESFEIPGEKPSVGSIIRSEMLCGVTDTKTVGGKLIVRGDAKLHILYCDDGGNMECLDFEMPVNEYIDLDGADEETTVCVELKSAGVKLTLKTDSDGEYRMIGVDAGVRAGISAYKPLEIDYVSDCYSTLFEIDSQSTQISLDSALKNVNESSMQKFNVELTGNLAEVYDIWCTPGDCTAQKTEENLKLSCPAVLSILGRDSDKSVSYIEKNIELCYNAPADFPFTKGEGEVTVSSISYNFSSGKLEVRINAGFTARFIDTAEVKAITAIVPDTDRPKNTQDACALTVYFAAKGEQLWDIAMAHNSTVESIMAENDIFEEILTEDRMLL
ncbi:MAG: DUF3794 domain-containing protein, partial [Clostridia bacterium]|nr:DUF3794 domain-containing protein [Clostridia bacterium]